MRMIERWFKGPSFHEGMHAVWVEDGAANWANCLTTACETSAECAQLAQIMGRLFPEAVCDCLDPRVRLIHFNNHPETTREQIDKIVATWQIEHGAGAGWAESR